VADTKLPKQIQAQLDEAAEIERQMTEATSPQGNTEPVNPEPQPPENLKPDQADPAPTPQAEVDDGFKKKYDALSGKYNKEVPRLHEQLREQSASLQKLQTELEALKAKPVEPPKPKEALVTEKDEETFGKDLIDVARRVTRDELLGLTDRLSALERAVASIAKIPERVQQIESRQVQSAEDRFWDEVNAQIPDWDVVDDDPEWIEFLGQKPPFSVRPYRELAVDAISAGDVAPLVELVNLWKEKSGKTQAIAQQNQIQQELQSQTQPNKQRAAPVVNADKGKIWTGEEYQNAFDIRLARTMSQADIDVLQIEAEKAYAEGRVRW
jgi:hypothetical protein